jgi:hypothetical protein
VNAGSSASKPPRVMAPLPARPERSDRDRSCCAAWTPESPPLAIGPKWPRAWRTAQGARSRVRGTSRSAPRRRSARRVSTGASPLQRSNPRPGPALTSPRSSAAPARRGTRRCSRGRRPAGR